MHGFAADVSFLYDFRSGGPVSMPAVRSYS